MGDGRDGDYSDVDDHDDADGDDGSRAWEDPHAWDDAADDDETPPHPPSHVCGRCGKVFESIAELHRHEERDHLVERMEEMIRKTSDGRITCRCGVILVSGREYADHYDTVHLPADDFLGRREPQRK